MLRSTLQCHFSISEISGHGHISRSHSDHLRLCLVHAGGGEQLLFVPAYLAVRSSCVAPSSMFFPVNRIFAPYLERTSLRAPLQTFFTLKGLIVNKRNSVGRIHCPRGRHRRRYQVCGRAAGDLSFCRRLPGCAERQLIRCSYPWASLLFHYCVWDAVARKVDGDRTIVVWTGFHALIIIADPPGEFRCDQRLGKPCPAFLIRQIISDSVELQIYEGPGRLTTFFEQTVVPPV